MDLLSSPTIAAAASRPQPTMRASSARGEPTFAQRLQQRLEAGTNQSLQAASRGDGAEPAAHAEPPSNEERSTDAAGMALSADLLAQATAVPTNAVPTVTAAPSAPGAHTPPAAVATDDAQARSVTAAHGRGAGHEARTNADAPALPARTVAAAASPGASAAAQRGVAPDQPAAAEAASQAAAQDPAAAGTAAAAPTPPAAASAAPAAVATVLPGGAPAEPPGAATDAVHAASELTLAQPLDEAAGMQALTLHVTQFTREGVGHARLHLNPADMGPVNVFIALDGTLARIDFEAAHAHTRSLIEGGLPQLASALHAEGLTLSGGSVSDHTRRDSPGHAHAQHVSPAQRARAIAVPAAGLGESAPRAAASSARGLLDLYA
jgi:flagellar hook-length control protein FliK